MILGPFQGHQVTFMLTKANQSSNHLVNQVVKSQILLQGYIRPINRPEIESAFFNRHFRS